MRNQTDKPLEERIEGLQHEIQQVLDLPELPYVIPFSALMLFYAQCAWGSSSAEFSDVDPSTRQSMLNGFFVDCIKSIMSHITDPSDLQSIFKLRQDAQKGTDISLDDTRRLLEYALEWSGASSLWNILRERIQSAFTEMIIAPEVIETIKAAQDFTYALDVLISARRIESVQEIKQRKSDIQQRRESCKVELEQLVDKFIQDITDLANRLAKMVEIKNDEEAAQEIMEIEEAARKKGWSGFPEFADFIDELVKDIIATIIIPIRGALNQRIGLYELEDTLSEIIPTHLANRLARSCDLAIRVFKDSEKSGDNFIIKVEVESERESRHAKIEHAERAALCLYQSVRKSLEHRAEFLLQAKAQRFESFVDSLASHTVQEIVSINLLDLPALKEILENTTSSQNLALPKEKVFDFPDPVVIDTTSEDQTKIVKIDRSCFQSPIYEKRVVGTKTYQQLRIPNFDKMAKQWIEGINPGKALQLFR